MAVDPSRDPTVVCKPYAAGPWYRAKGLLLPNPAAANLEAQESTVHHDWDSVLDDVANFVARPTDIFCVGYPKAGLHLMHEVLHMVTRRCSNYTSIGKSSSTLEALARITGLSNLPRDDDKPEAPPRVFLTHLPLQCFPQSALKQGCRIIYLLRNPKDTAVSLFEHLQTLRVDGVARSAAERDSDWERFLADFVCGDSLYGSWVAHVCDWYRVASKYPDQVRLLHLEDVVADIHFRLLQLSLFLECFETDAVLRRAALQCEFYSMKAALGGAGASAHRQRAAACLRRGRPGYWPERFTSEQEQLLVECFAERLLEVGIRLDLGSTSLKDVHSVAAAGAVSKKFSPSDAVNCTKNNCSSATLDSKLATAATPALRDSGALMS